jgi:MFS family permease
MLSSEAKTIVGIMLMKFATGYMSNWGVISLYILSYFHYYGSPISIKSSTNSLAMVIIVIPVICCFFLSPHIANKIGYVLLIRICAISFLLFPLLSFVNFNFVSFFICNMVIPSCTFSLSFIPLFHCMYSYNNQHKNLATAIIFGSFSLGAITWNVIATLFINPDNLIPNIPSD